MKTVLFKYIYLEKVKFSKIDECVGFLGLSPRAKGKLVN